MVSLFLTRGLRLCGFAKLKGRVVKSMANLEGWVAKKREDGKLKGWVNK